MAMIVSGVSGANPPPHLKSVGLDEQDAPFRVQSAGDVDACCMEDALLHLCRIVADGHSVIVYDAKDA